MKQGILAAAVVLTFGISMVSQAENNKYVKVPGDAEYVDACLSYAKEDQVTSMEMDAYMEQCLQSFREIPDSENPDQIPDGENPDQIPVDEVQTNPDMGAEGSN